MFEKTIAALKERNQNEWHIADALLAEIAPAKVGRRYVGESWEMLAERLAEEGIDYSVSTLRQYRDTAARWPVEERVDGVSFTAHRAANKAQDRGKVIRRLREERGKVTVASVKQAVAKQPTKQQRQTDARKQVADAVKAITAIQKMTVKRATATPEGVKALEDLMSEMRRVPPMVIEALDAAKQAPKATIARRVLKGDDRQAAKQAPSAKSPKAAPKAAANKSAKAKKGRTRGI